MSEGQRERQRKNPSIATLPSVPGDIGIVTIDGNDFRKFICVTIWVILTLFWGFFICLFDCCWMLVKKSYKTVEIYTQQRSSVKTVTVSPEVSSMPEDDIQKDNDENCKLMDQKFESDHKKIQSSRSLDYLDLHVNGSGLDDALMNSRQHSSWNEGGSLASVRSGKNFTRSRTDWYATTAGTDTEIGPAGMNVDGPLRGSRVRIVRTRRDRETGKLSLKLNSRRKKKQSLFYELNEIKKSYGVCDSDVDSDEGTIEATVPVVKEPERNTSTNYLNVIMERRQRVMAKPDTRIGILVQWHWCYDIMLQGEGEVAKLCTAAGVKYPLSKFVSSKEEVPKGPPVKPKGDVLMDYLDACIIVSSLSGEYACVPNPKMKLVSIIGKKVSNKPDWNILSVILKLD